MCKDYIDLGFTKEKFPAGTHMCLIYSNEEERRKVMKQFLESGLNSGDKVAYFADDKTIEGIKEWFSSLGIDPDIKNNQLILDEAVPTYCPDGKFDPDNMLNTLEEFYLESIKENFPTTRASGEMTWALKGIPGSERLMEYEAKLNDFLKIYPVTAICQYDATKFDGASILECIKVHPYLIVHGQVVRNPYFIKPEEYLKTINY